MGGYLGRRTYLVTSVAGLVAGAGCLGDDADSTGGSDSDSEEDIEAKGGLVVTEKTGTIGAGDTITRIDLTVELADPTDDVDLERTAVQYVYAGETTRLVHEASDDGTTDRFTTTPITAADESNDELSSSGDRYDITIPLDDETLTPTLDVLTGGDDPTVTIVPPRAGRTGVELAVPEPMPYAEVGRTVAL